MATELEDLEVDRVDGVDDPATKRRFLFAKSEDVDELRLTLNAIGKSARSTLTRLSKCEDGYDAETLADLKKLAKLCDLAVEFKERKAKETPKPEEKKDAPAGDAAGLVAALKAGLSEGFGDLKKSIEGMTSKLDELAKGEEGDDEEDPQDDETEKAEGDEDPMDDEEDDEEDVAARKRKRSQKKKVSSSQARDDTDRVAKGSGSEFGKGMFGSVIFGQRRR